MINQYKAVCPVSCPPYSIVEFGETEIVAKRNLISRLDTDFYDVQRGKIKTYIGMGGLNPNLVYWTKIIKH